MFNKLNFLILLFALLFSMSYVNARPVDEVYGGVSDGQTIYYSFFTNKWYYQRPSKSTRSVLEVTRHETGDKGAYSEYVSPEKTVYYPAGSNYEFLYKGSLIAYHLFSDKFYQIVYNKKNKAFIEIPLEQKVIKKLMGNPEIILISSFKKGEDNYSITVKKLPLKWKSFLIINDTDQYFYKYSLDIPEKDKNIKTYFYTKTPKTVKYSHYMDNRDEFMPYVINIKNGF